MTTCHHASICRPSCRRRPAGATPPSPRPRVQRLPRRQCTGRGQGPGIPGPALEATGDGSATAAALVPWICDALLSNHSVKAYGRDFMDFVRHMQAQSVTPLEVTADHVKI